MGNGYGGRMLRFNTPIHLFLVIIAVMGLTYYVFITHHSYLKCIVALLYGIYPIVYVWENNEVRKVDKRERESDTFFTIVSTSDVRALEGEYSRNSLLYVRIFSGMIIAMRLLSPDKVQLAETVYALLLFVSSWIIYRKRGGTS